METPAAIRKMILLLSVSSLLCTIVGFVIWHFQPPSFSSRRDAIIYTIEQRGYVVEELQIDRRWPDTVNYQVYGAGLHIRVRGQEGMLGRVECRDMEHSCWIAVAKLRMNRVPMPDISIAREPELVVWIKNVVKKVLP